MRRTSFLSMRYRGYLMVAAAAALWGLSGTAAQVLFQQHGFHPGWMVTVRLLVSGMILLSIAWFTDRKSVWSVWKSSRERIRVLLFGLIGMLGVQYTYFLAVKEGNAAIATLLQYLAPAMIVLYLALRMGKNPTVRELIAVFLAMLGTFLLVTDGSFDGLNVPGAAVAWGIASAVALAFYTLYPVGLLKRWGATVTVGWGMLVGGMGLSLLNPPWQTEGQIWSFSTAFFVLFIIVFGTLAAFYLYLDSLRHISPSEASVIACVEPLTAAVASVACLKVPLGIYGAIGGLCILATVVLLSLRAQEPERQRAEAAKPPGWEG